MSKKYNIRWTADDNEALRKAVKNFNAKRSRIIKKSPEKTPSLPEKVNMKDIKELIQTRKDLNTILNRLRSFSEKGAEELVVAPFNENNIEITRWQVEQMEKMAKTANRRRAIRKKMVQDIQLHSRNQPLGYTIGDIGMGSEEENNLSNINAFTKSMDRTSLRKKFRTLEREAMDRYWEGRERNLKEQYKNAFLENFNPDDVKEVVEAIDKMSFQQFYKKFLEEDRYFEAPYLPNQEVYEEFLESLKATWIPNYEGV